MQGISILLLQECITAKSAFSIWHLSSALNKTDNIEVADSGSGRYGLMTGMIQIAGWYFHSYNYIVTWYQPYNKNER